MQPGSVFVVFEEGDVAGRASASGRAALITSVAVAVDRPLNEIRQLPDGDAHGVRPFFRERPSPREMIPLRGGGDNGVSEPEPYSA